MERYENGIRKDLTEALAENAVARLRFNAMTEEERKSFLRRTDRAKGREELKALTDELAGWRRGHPPYQL